MQSRVIFDYVVVYAQMLANCPLPLAIPDYQNMNELFYIQY